MSDEQPSGGSQPDDFDLDIRVKIVTRQVERFVVDETETCETCGSCTSECDLQGQRLFEDRIHLEIDQVGSDGVTRRIAGKQVIRRVEP